MAKNTLPLKVRVVLVSKIEELWDTNAHQFKHGLNDRQVGELVSKEVGMHVSGSSVSYARSSLGLKLSPYINVALNGKDLKDSVESRLRRIETKIHRICEKLGVELEERCHQ